MTVAAALHPNRKSADHCLDYYQKELTPFVLRHLKKVRGGTVEEHIRNALGGGTSQQLEHFNSNMQKFGNQVEKALDLPDLHIILQKRWNEAFRKALSRHGVTLETLRYIAGIRNEVKHPLLDDLTAEQTLQFINEILNIAAALNPAPESLEQIRQERYAVMARCLNEYRAEQNLPPLGEPEETPAEVKAAQTAELESELEELRAAHAAELAAERESFQGEADRNATIRAWTQELLALEAAAAARSASVIAEETAAAQYEAALAKHEAALAGLKAQPPGTPAWENAQAKAAATAAALSAAATDGAERDAEPDPLPAAIRAFEQSLGSAGDPALAEIQAEIRRRQATAAETLAALRGRQAQAQRRRVAAQQRQEHAASDFQAAQEQPLTPPAEDNATAAAVSYPKNPKHEQEAMMPNFPDPEPNPGNFVPTESEAEIPPWEREEEDPFAPITPAAPPEPAAPPAAHPDFFQPETPAAPAGPAEIPTFQEETPQDNFPPAAAAPAPLLPPDLTTRWKELTRQLGRQKGQQYTLGALLRDCRAPEIHLDADGTTLILPFRNALNAQRMNGELQNPEVRKIVEAAAAQAFGHPYAVAIQPPNA